MLDALRSRARPVVRFWRRFGEADPGLMAAAVAYNAFFALVPLGVAFVTAASFIGQNEEALARTEETLRAIAPGEVADFFVDLLRQTGEAVGGQQGWVIAISLGVALVAGSRGVLALQKALRRIAHFDERRSGVRRRLIAIGLTLGAGATTLALILALVLTEPAAEFLSDLIRFDLVRDLWVWLRFPAAVLALYVFLRALYRWGPPRPIPAAGLAAALATSGVILGSLAFGWYLSVVGLGNTFGILGAVAVALLWLYLGAYVILLGAAVIAYGWRWPAADHAVESTAAKDVPPG